MINSFHNLGIKTGFKEQNDNTTIPQTKTMQIYLETYSKLQKFSRRNHSVPASYDDLIIELIDFYNEKNETKYTNNNYFHLRRI